MASRFWMVSQSTSALSTSRITPWACHPSITFLSRPCFVDMISYLRDASWVDLYSVLNCQLTRYRRFYSNFCSCIDYKLQWAKLEDSVNSTYKWDRLAAAFSHFGVKVLSRTKSLYFSWVQKASSDLWQPCRDLNTTAVYEETFIWRHCGLS